MTTTIVVHTEGPGDHGHPPDWAAPGDPLMEIAPHVSDARSALQIRREIAAALDLDVAERACASFRAFLQELEALEL